MRAVRDPRRDSNSITDTPSGEFDCRLAEAGEWNPECHQFQNEDRQKKRTTLQPENMGTAENSDSAWS